MIKSITFTGKFGYITEKIPEPDCSVRGFNGNNENDNRFSDEDRKKITKWKKKMKEWKKHKDEYLHPQLVNNLLGRKIEFEPGKINLIFGPNASGKTTILKAIAGNAGIENDGYPKLYGPLEFDKGIGEKMTNECVRNFYNKLMKNSADIEWDGSPVYYDNFANRKNYGYIGDMLGSVLGNDLVTEIEYRMNKNQISLGQNSIYLLNRLMDIAKKHLCFADIFKDYVNKNGTIKKMKINDVWTDAYRLQLEYFLGFEKSLVKSPGTFLFDELDKSLDVANIYALYNDVLPKLVEETGVQVIIISHSPLVLSEKILGNNMYNFISMDEAYTEDCITNLKKLF
jgi:predicted ATPase